MSFAVEFCVLEKRNVYGMRRSAQQDLLKCRHLEGSGLCLQSIAWEAVESVVHKYLRLHSEVVNLGHETMVQLL